MGAGELFGHLHCRHAHCAELTLRDVLQCFSEDQIKAAKEAVGSTVSPGGAESASVGSDEGQSDLVSVLIPGQHEGEDGPVEVSTDQFAQAVLDALPPDALYRMDFLVGQIAGAQGRRKFFEIDDTAMRMVVDRYVRLCSRRRDKEGGIREVYVPCGRDLAALVRSAASVSPGIRSLRQLVAYPVYLPGFELASPGWNATGGIYYDEPPELRDLTPESTGALDVLRDLLIDWPFVDEASRENAFGMMLTAVLRPAIEGPIPFHLVIASIERTGKGKLVDMALGYAVRGESVELLQIGTSEAEREKRITSLLLRSASAVHFDNIATDQVLDSATIASLGTAYPNWGGRILGNSKAPQLPNNATWVMSANNPSASSEIAKRTVPIVLQPLDDKPHLRSDFAHPDCFVYAKARRRAVLEAMLGIVEAWKRAGRPSADVVMGGYERWTEAVGGTLRQAGAASWMGNYTRWVTSADDTQVDVETLVDAWAARFRTGEVTAAQLLPIVEETGAFRWVLSRPTQAGQIVALGRKVLKPLTNRPVKGWIVRRSASGSSASYRLERLGASPGSDGHRATATTAQAPKAPGDVQEYVVNGERRERGIL